MANIANFKNKDPSAVGARISAAELELRVSFVYDLILQEYRTGEIVEEVMKKWKTCEATGHNYIKRAQKKLKDRTASTREERLAKTEEQFRMLFRNACAKQDHRGAAMIKEKYHQLFGDYPEQREDEQEQLPFDADDPSKIEELLDAIPMEWIQESLRRRSQGAS